MTRHFLSFLLVKRFYTLFLADERLLNQDKRDEGGLDGISYSLISTILWFLRKTKLIPVIFYYRPLFLWRWEVMVKQYKKLMSAILAVIFILPIGADENTASTQSESQKKREFTLKSVKEKIKSVKNKVIKKKDVKEEAPSIDAFTPSQMYCVGKALEKHTVSAYEANVDLFKSEHKKCMATENPAEENQPLANSFFNNFKEKLFCLDELLSWKNLELTPEEAVEEYHKRCKH